MNDDTPLVSQNASGEEEATKPQAQITSTLKAGDVAGRMVGVEIGTVAGHVTIDEIHQNIGTLIVQARSAVELYGESVDLTREMIALDGATLNELLDAEENLTDAELALAANLRAQAIAFVALNSSLGATVKSSSSTVVADAQ